MNHVTLLIVADDPAAADRLRERVAEPLSGVGFAGDRITTTTIHDLAADPALLVPGTVAWVIADDHTLGSELYEVLATVQDRHIPAAFSPLRPGTTGAVHQDSVVILPGDSAPQTAAATLGALASQAQSIEELTTEARLLRAHHIGMADQIGKIDEELRMAVKIQREFLPKALPNLDPLRFDIMWRPAGYVSGDIYDVIRLDEHHVGVFIADAVGHGVPAALMTIYIKQSLRTKEIVHGSKPGYRLLSPDEALQHLNLMLLEQDGGSTCFATAVYAVVDTRTGVMQLARAGHPLPVMLRHDRDTEMLNPDGPMLGVFDTGDFDVLTVQMRPGDRLLLYSDGYEMAFPDPTGDGGVASERYLQEFEALRKGDAPDAMERFTGLIDHQAGSLNQRDDLTLLCVSVPADAVFAETEAEANSDAAQADKTDNAPAQAA